ncbi:MAG: esterase [Acidobacteria bacterium]|nr:esterase [Acidobacteriota bacterium]
MPTRSTLFLLLATLAPAQQANVNFDWNPHKNTENLAPFGAAAVSPEVHDDRTVTFRVKAPEARQVALATGPFTLALGKNRPQPFEKQADGMWTLKVGPVKPNIYVYKLLIDGVSVADPSNTVAGFGNQPPFSEVIIPGDGPAYYDARRVAHGAVTRHVYTSTVTNGEREMWIYTPPSYDRGKRYPVLYLLGGSGELASGWFLYGRVNFILDNLIAEGKATPMIIAMPNNQIMHRSHPRHIQDSFPLFEKELRTQVIPFVERHYSVRSDRRSRAISGLSMGGRQTELVGFPCVDLFSSFGVLSAGDLDAEKSVAAFLNAADTRSKVDYLLIGYGTYEEAPLNTGSATGPRGSVADRSKALAAALKAHSIPHELYVGGDGGHDWGTWRHLVHEKLLPALWRKR